MKGMQSTLIAEPSRSGEPTIERVGARLLSLAVCALLAGCGPEGDAGRDSSEPAGSASAITLAQESTAARDSAAPPELKALPGRENSVPQLTQKTRVRMRTTAGEILIDVYPAAAPNAAKRFIELVEAGFYDDTPISRVVPGFVAQFGINWRERHKAWKDNTFDDDLSLFALERGTLAFAKGGKNTNSTQVFINYGENSQLTDPRYNFAAFGKVVRGMEIVDQFAQVGDPSGGLDQGRLWADGAAYLESLPVKPTMIQRALVVR